MEYAGFWRRFTALSLDGIIFVAFYMLILQLISDAFTSYWIYQICCILYYVGLTTSNIQGTLGQALLNIKIGNLDGSKINPLQSFSRFVLWMFPAWPIIIYAGLPDVLTLQDTIVSVEDNPAEMQNIINSPEMALFGLYFSALSGLAIIGGLILMISIGASKEKAGIYDRICKQRAFKITKKEKEKL